MTIPYTRKLYITAYNDLQENIRPWFSIVDTAAKDTPKNQIC
jgi:hypothetical protein